MNITTEQIAKQLAEMCLEMKKEGEVGTDTPMDKLLVQYEEAVASEPADDWWVGHDGPSRPIIHGPGVCPGSVMLSISQFQDGRWVSYDDEEEHCKLFVKAANQELRPPKPGMKIVAKDNFDSGSISDELVAENVPIFYAEKIVKFLNDNFSGDNAQRIYKMELPTYKLFVFDPR